MTDLPQFDKPATAPHTGTETAFTVFLRIVAALSLLAGLKYWIALVGFFDYRPWRFDLMPVHWQLAATSLAVLFPVAATGLWLPVSWGPVMWAAAAGIETAMYGALPLLFGRAPVVLYLHGTVALIYVGFRIALRIQRKRRNETVSLDSP